MTMERDTRTKILEAAAQLLRDKGISGTTTREIARAAGLSDAAIYSHFKSRGELLNALMPASLVDYKGSADAFLKRVGQGTVKGNLKFFMKRAREFFLEASPKIALILAEPELFDELGGRPVKGSKAETFLTDYIRAEQRMGRINEEADAAAIGTIVVATAFYEGFTAGLLGKAFTAERPSSADEIIDALMVGLAPRKKVGSRKGSRRKGSIRFRDRAK
jgi:DNA-binding transcriptional ArsR family regulator